MVLRPPASRLTLTSPAAQRPALRHTCRHGIINDISGGSHLQHVGAAPFPGSRSVENRLRHPSCRSRKSGVTSRSLAWLRCFACYFRIHASVVERACKKSHDDRARSGAVRVRTAVVVALASGDGADDQPDDDYDRSDTHDCLRRHVRWEWRPASSRDCHNPVNASSGAGYAG